MRCCVPFCKATAEIVSESAGISFHEFPREVHLRAAWLRALGKQHNLPDSAVVCSQHFRTGAIPSMVQVCMICLDTHSKLFLMSKYNLDEAYQHLVGHPPCDQGNLKQTLCVQCAQRLANFSRFRDKSLRARALMMELVEKHELITIRHMKSINRVKNQLISDIVKTVLEPDHSNVHIAHSDTDTLTELDATVEAVAVKHESCDSMSVDADHTQQVTVPSEEVSEADSFTGCSVVACKEEYLSDDSELSGTEQMSDALLTTASTCKQEVGEALAQSEQEMTFACTTCLMEFADEDMYSHHTMTHMEDNENPDGDSAADCSHTSAPLSAILATDDDSKVYTTKEADAEQKINQKGESNYGGLENQSLDSKIYNCVVKLYDISKTFKKVPRRDESLTKTLKAVSSSGGENIVFKHVSYQATSQNKVPTTQYIDPVTCSSSNVKVIVSKTCSNDVINIKNCNQSQNILHTEERPYICDICRKMYKRKSFLVKHIKTHTEVGQFTCNICQYKCKYRSYLRKHVRTHIGEKPFCCKICKYKCIQNSGLMMHMRTHTGEKPYHCKLCDYKCARKYNLVMHMRTHTGEKPHHCKLCDYKCISSSRLVLHMRNHTGIKPFLCKVCHYKCTQSRYLVAHMRTHTGEKPFSCTLCDYKCAENSSLLQHMRTHTGEKPFSCMLCDYKCTKNSSLVRHMQTHTGEKPYLCNICEYKSAVNAHLVKHMRTHTGIKPFSCMLCDYKCTQNSSLVRHMRTHTGEKPYSCKICEYKTADKSHLVNHMRTHTGEKPYSCTICEYKYSDKRSLSIHTMRAHTGEFPFCCEICEYKCAQKSYLVKHMRIHTGEKPHHCKLCDHKCAHKSQLVRHMRTHSVEKD